MPSEKMTKAGHSLANVLGIKLEEPEFFPKEVSRGESVFSDTTETYVEQTPTTLGYLSQFQPTSTGILHYFRSLFPFINWVHHYNLEWLMGDLVAGITIGCVVVPQGMAYAILAKLPPQYGLYTSFMGVFLYWFFATSKDITIGPVAVLSTVTGNVVVEVTQKLPHVDGHVVASALSILAGAVVLFIGLIRCGWIVDIIPLTALSAFMTGSAFTIAAGQVPSMMGITGFSHRDAAYRVIINTLKGLPDTQLDAAMGLTALAMLYIIRSACAYCAKKFPQHAKTFFFLQTLRTAFVILLYTMISWLVNRTRRENPAFNILSTVPRGFQSAGTPYVDTEIASEIVSFLPATVIVMLIEHIAISKSFGRVNNYTIDPSQEMVAMGVTNTIAPFVGAYASTGSFSRTAIKSKAGVRTPFAGVITAVVVLLAIYALPPVFFYIPKASLAAVIIHAVGDLITPPNTLYKFWRVNPLEVVIFFVGVFVTIFDSIEDGIYATVCISAAVLLFRILRARGHILGRVKVHSVLGDHVIGEKYRHPHPGAFNETNCDNDVTVRNVFLPMDHIDGSNPQIEPESPYPGIFIYRFSEGFNYPNAAYTLEYLTSYVFKHTRRTNLKTYGKKGERPWNDPGPTKRQLRKLEEAERNGDASPEMIGSTLPGADPTKPTLKAIILDFSSVNNVDVTSIQTLIDVRNQLDRYTTPDKVDWHIASANNQWTKRALVSAGFGFPSERSDGLHHHWRGIFSVAEIGGDTSAAAVAEKEINREVTRNQGCPDEEKGEMGAAAPAADGKQQKDKQNGLAPPTTLSAEDSEISRNSSSDGNDDSSSDDPKLNLQKEVLPKRMRKPVAVHGLNRPLFHTDLTSALQSAIANVAARQELRPESAGNAAR